MAAFCSTNSELGQYGFSVDICEVLRRTHFLYISEARVFKELPKSQPQRVDSRTCSEEGGNPEAEHVLAARKILQSDKSPVEGRSPLEGYRRLVSRTRISRWGASSCRGSTSPATGGMPPCY